MTYEHDGSHPQHYRHWARMMGEITHVFEPPKVGFGRSFALGCCARRAQHMHV